MARVKQLGARRLALVATIAAALGFVFAAYSTYDYAEQLDRQVHAVHCSFVPGLPASTDGDNPCKAALFSAYSAVFRATFWGGLPISLFAMGAFAFFLAFGLYLSTGPGARGEEGARVSGRDVPRAARRVDRDVLRDGPPPPRLLQAVRGHVRVVARADGGGLARVARPSRARAKPPTTGHGREPWGMATARCSGSRDSAWPRPCPRWRMRPACPTTVRCSTKCGKLAITSEPHNSLLKLPTAHPLRAVVLFEDPLCPTCKAFHERLVDEGVFERLDVTLVLFPLDSECNWMLDRALHPGACIMAKAVLCGGDDKARAILEWSYDHQDELREVGKQGAPALLAKIADRWGSAVVRVRRQRDGDDAPQPAPALRREQPHRGLDAADVPRRPAHLRRGHRPRAEVHPGPARPGGAAVMTEPESPRDGPVRSSTEGRTGQRSVAVAVAAALVLVATGAVGVDGARGEVTGSSTPRTPPARRSPSPTTPRSRTARRRSRRSSSA